MQLKAMRLKKGVLTLRPSVLLLGASGAGKTDAIGQLLDAGYRVLVGDAEGRAEAIQRYEPLIAPLPTREHVAELLAILRDTKQRQKFVKDGTDGAWDDIDIFAHDSLGEYSWQLDSDMEVQHKGSTNKYARYEEYGRRFVNLCRLERDLASAKMERPIGVISTLGLHERVTEYGQKTVELGVKGNVVPKHINHQFTFVLRMRALSDGEKAQFLLDTVTMDDVKLKGPGPGVLAPTIDITRPGKTTFVDVYRTLEQYLSG